MRKWIENSFIKRNRIYFSISLVCFIIFSLFYIYTYQKEHKQLSISTISSDTPPDKIAQIIISHCTNQKKGALRDTSDCYAKSFYSITNRTDYKHAFSSLLALVEIDDQAKSCHFIAHRIGQGAYDVDPGNWRNILGSINSECGYGGLHGVLEGYIGAGGTVDKSTVPTFCDKDPACLHGLGHIILINKDNDIKLAKDLCRALSGDWHEQQCLNGVYMERFIPYSLVDHGIVSRDRILNFDRYLNEYESLCQVESGNAGISCWAQISHVAVGAFNSDAARSFTFCSRANDQKSASGCRREALVELLRNINFDLNRANSFCEIPQPNDPKFKGDCYNMLINIVMNNTPDRIQEAVTYCSSLVDKYRSGCVNEIKIAVNRLVERDPDKAYFICQGLTERPDNLCSFN